MSTLLTSRSSQFSSGEENRRVSSLIALDAYMKCQISGQTFSHAPSKATAQSGSWGVNKAAKGAELL